MKYLRKRIKNNRENKTDKTDKTMYEVCHGCKYLSLIRTYTDDERYAGTRPVIAVCNRLDSEAIVLSDSLSEFYCGEFVEESCPFKKWKGKRDEISEKQG